MSVIGEQIKKYRIEKDITQEQLGQLLGVTTQAVSRWERGGTPDAELLPRLSEVLGVSIDSLFGREEQSIPTILARKLSQMPQPEAYRYTINICWAIQVGLLGEISLIDDIMNKFIDASIINEGNKRDYFSKVISESGMATMRMSADFDHFFLLSDPTCVMKDRISDSEKLRKVFKLLSDEKLLNIILYLYSLPHMPVATSLISKSLGMSENEIDRNMKILVDNHLVRSSVVATAYGNINSYSFREESFVIPLLCFADEIIKSDMPPIFGKFERSKPYI